MKLSSNFFMLTSPKSHQISCKISCSWHKTLHKIKAMMMDNFFPFTCQIRERKNLLTCTKKYEKGKFSIVSMWAENEGRNQWQDSIFPLIFPSCSRHCDDDKWFSVCAECFRFSQERNALFEFRSCGLNYKLDKRLRDLIECVRNNLFINTLVTA